MHTYLFNRNNLFSNKLVQAEKRPKSFSVTNERRVQHLIECRVFGIILIPIKSRTYMSSFHFGGPTAGAGGGKVSLPTTSLKKRQQ